MTPRPTARIFRGTPRNLARLARVLREGGLVGVPTETVYGLAANALDPVACRQIFAAKGRPSHDPLIVHLASAADVDRVAFSNPAVEKLARRFWPGPLTLVLPKKPCVPDLVSAGLPSVAVRVPAHPLFRRLLRQTGLPLAAPSANPFGYISPTTAEHVRAHLGDRIGFILDGGPARIGIESTILDLRDPDRPRLLRPGAITAAEIARVLGRPVGGAPTRTRRGAQVSPGLLKKHYSPHTPVRLHERIDPHAPAQHPREAWVFLDRPPHPAPNVFSLGNRTDLPGIARRLFRRLRELDTRGFEAIHVELAPGTGLADAINDRLRRAAAPA